MESQTYQQWTDTDNIILKAVSIRLKKWKTGYLWRQARVAAKRTRSGRRMSNTAKGHFRVETEREADRDQVREPARSKSENCGGRMNKFKGRAWHIRKHLAAGEDVS